MFSRILYSVSFLDKYQKLQVLNCLLKNTGLKAVLTEEISYYEVAAKLRIVAHCIQSDDRSLLAEAIAEFLGQHRDDDDLKRFLEQAIECVSKATTKRKLQIIARQIYEQLRLNPSILNDLINSPEVLDFYMRFRTRCTDTKLIEIAKTLAECS